MGQDQQDNNNKNNQKPNQEVYKKDWLYDLAKEGATHKRRLREGKIRVVENQDQEGDN